MEKWILVLSIVVGAHAETHARGPFSSPRNCWTYVRYLNADPLMPNYLGRCMPVTEFARLYPTLKLDEDS